MKTSSVLFSRQAVGEIPALRWVSTAGGVLIAVAALLPWVTATAPFVGTLSFAGTDGDGKFTLVIGIVVAAVAAIQNRYQALVVIAGVLVAGGLAVNAIYNLNEAISDMPAGVHVSIGIGLWLTLIGAVAAGVGAVWLPNRS